MALRHSNLLLSDAAAPANGIQFANVVPWYGGRLNVVADGDFGGATIELLGSVRLPKLAVNQGYAEVMDEDDFFVLHNFADGEIYNDNINPCMLAVRVSGVAAGTRVRIIVN